MYSEYSFKKSIQEVNKQRIDKLLLTKLYANHFPIELRRNTEALIHWRIPKVRIVYMQMIYDHKF